MKDKVQPEIKDLTDNIQRFCAANKHNVAFIGAFCAYKEGDEKCEDCGKPIEEIRDDANRIFIFGHLSELRSILNELRDIVEDSVDEDGFVML